MTETLRTETESFRVWRNPQGPDDSIRYMGEVCPPPGQPFLTACDLRALGFRSGCYTVLTPAKLLETSLFSKWQTVIVTG